MEKEDLHAIDENVNPINETTMEISIWFPWKFKNITTIWSPGHIPKGIEITVQQRCLCIYGYHESIHNTKL
jgi:hypothetical protein